MYIIVIMMWVGFAFIHSLLIDFRFSAWTGRLLGRYYAFYRIFYNLLSILLFMTFQKYTKSLDKKFVIKFVPPWTILQYGLIIFSCLIILWAFLSYDPLEFIGIRQIKEIREKNTLPKTITDKGLLGIVRHPMYLATIVLMWSLNSTRIDIMVHTILTGYILIGIRLEEKKLVKQFGLSYMIYQKKIPALIPFIRRVK
ncbi:NnrU protein [Desulfosporosinus acididurans]|uniref:NnrU protein n=1 Tax=Desulfosporosinus acididurans TaxID=476652 RepID=A0A0J1FX70_9FIRM|nr:NnrU family protein [Desulfosporosinus acididurans]KLU67907.1 NnrU protein [Desulfosporosinus acididurans]